MQLPGPVAAPEMKVEPGPLRSVDLIQLGKRITHKESKPETKSVVMARRKPELVLVALSVQRASEDILPELM